MRVCQSKVRIQGNTKVSRVRKCKLEDDNNGRREIATRVPRIETSLASQPHFRKKGKSQGAGHGFTVCAVHQTFPFAKVDLICETIDRDEERGGKQQEIVKKKTNTRRLRVYYLYTMPHI